MLKFQAFFSTKPEAIAERYLNAMSLTQNCLRFSRKKTCKHVVGSKEMHLTILKSKLFQRQKYKISSNYTKICLCQIEF